MAPGWKPQEPKPATPPAARPSSAGVLKVTLVEGKELLAVDKGGTSDPFAVLQLLDQTPRTPGGERTPRTPGGRFIKRSGSDKTKIHISTSGDATTVTLETTTTGDVKCGATPATAAPEADAMIAKPSLSRAEALGARPGHFARTHAKAVAADVLTIVVPNDGEVSPKSAKTVRVRRQLKPGGAKSPKRAQELKSEREQELEARLALLEAQLAQQRPGGDNDAGRHDDAAAAAALETFAEASAPGLVAMVSA